MASRGEIQDLITQYINSAASTEFSNPDFLEEHLL